MSVTPSENASLHNKLNNFVSADAEVSTSRGAAAKSTMGKCCSRLGFSLFWTFSAGLTAGAGETAPGAGASGGGATSAGPTAGIWT